MYQISSLRKRNLTLIQNNFSGPKSFRVFRETGPCSYFYSEKKWLMGKKRKQRIEKKVNILQRESRIRTPFAELPDV